MDWLKDYQLYLFDLDGLLVNTEEIHYMAYKRMCANRGFDFDWDFNRYCRVAHYSAHGLREHIYAHFPELKVAEPNWDVLYAEKKRAMIDFLNEGAVHPMPGVEKLLLALQDASIPRCVVTHSPHELVAVLRRKNPILDTIPAWFTREHYFHPKPHPECYHKAIETLSRPHDRIIGFEDTPRGLMALMETRATSVLVCQANYPEIPLFLSKGALHFSTLASLPDARLLQTEVPHSQCKYKETVRNSH